MIALEPHTVQLNPDIESTQEKENRTYQLRDRDLMWLREELKLINANQYVFFALLVDYGRFDVSLTEPDIEAFMERWSIDSEQLWSAIAQLQKKKIVTSKKVPAIQLELFEEGEE